MSLIDNFSKLCVHTQTTKPWSIEECITHFSAAGIKGISIWRHLLDGKDLKSIKAILDAHKMEVVSLVRGGFFPAVEPEKRDLALESNRIAIEEAAVIGAPLLVLVCGADPRQSLEISRQQIKQGITALIPYAKSKGVKLAIEPIHHMYAGDKSAIVSLGQANNICEAIASPWVGIAIDVYHLWWDPDLEEQTKRTAEADRLFAFHVCDWMTPTKDLLNDRGLMGEGCVDVPGIRSLVEKNGFTGMIEVEVFSNRWWKKPTLEFLEAIKESYLKHT